jgi:hypothetical protein
MAGLNTPKQTATTTKLSATGNTYFIGSLSFLPAKSVAIEYLSPDTESAVRTRRIRKVHATKQKRRLKSFDRLHRLEVRKKTSNVV